MPTSNDGHFHYPQHVWERSAKAPEGPPVLNWPATSPPADEKKAAKKALVQKDEKKKADLSTPYW
jgi:hypothetical protein